MTGSKAGVVQSSSGRGLDVVMAVDDDPRRAAVPRAGRHLAQHERVARRRRHRRLAARAADLVGDQGRRAPMSGAWSGTALTLGTRRRASRRSISSRVTAASVRTHEAGLLGAPPRRSLRRFIRAS